MDKLPVAIGIDRSSMRTLMAQISQSANTTRDLAEWFHLIEKQLNEYLSAEHFIIALQDQHQKTFRILYADSQYLPRRLPLPDYNKAVEATINQNKPTKSLDILESHSISVDISENELLSSGFWIGAPFSLSGDSVKGCLILHSTSRDNDFTKDDQSVLQFAASQTAIAIYRNQNLLLRDENERTFRGVLTTAPMGMQLYSIDPEKNLLLTGFNPAANQIFETDHSFLMGKTIEEVIPDLEDTEIPNQFLKVAREGGTYQSEQVIYELGQIHKAYQVNAFQTEPGKIAVMFVEISDHKRSDESLRMRDGILSTIAFASEQFLESHTWTERIQRVLERLGEVTGSSRIFLSENRFTPDGNAVAKPKYEWRISSLGNKIVSPWCKEFPFTDLGFHHWAEAMKNGEVIHRLVRNLPKNEADLLDKYKILSVAAAPLIINHQWWGLVGFENHYQERMFSSDVLESIKSVSNTISAAISREQRDAKLYEKAARVDALVKTAASLNTNLEPESVIETVCAEIARGLNAKIVSIYLYNEESKALHCAGGYNLVENCFRVFDPIPLETLNRFQKLNNDLIQLRDDVSIQEFFQSPVHELFGTKNIVSWVITFDQKLIGTLNIILEDDERTLANEELNYVKGLTNEAALAINNARLLLTEKIRSKELTTLYDLSVNLNTSISVDEALEITLSSVQDLLEADAGMIVLHDESKSSLSIPFATGYLAANTGHIFDLRDKLDLYLDISSRIETTHESPENGLFSELKGIRLCGSTTTIPLLSANEPVGILVATRKKNGDLKPLSPFDERLLRAIGELSGTTVRKAQFYEDGQRRLTFLQALRAIDIEISSNLELKSTLNIVLDEVLANLKVDAAAVLTFNLTKGELEFGAQKGFTNESLYKSYRDHAESYAELAAFDQRMFLLPDIRGKQTNFTQSQLFLIEHFVAYVAVPLLAKGEIRGVLEVFSREPFRANQEWLEFLETLAGQTAIAIEHTKLFENIQFSNKELLKAYDITIEGWSSALDLKDSDTEGHTRRVAELTEKLAKSLGIQENDLIHLRRGALLHDIGKMGVPDQILRKPGPLNDEEWSVMKKHPVYAYEWLSPAEYLRPALDIPYSHHEKWDGSGYPLGLKGTEIPLQARIFSLVDVWDALSSDRPYRQRWNKEEVVNYIHNQSKSHFDPEIVPVFLDLVKDQDFIQ